MKLLKGYIGWARFEIDQVARGIVGMYLLDITESQRQNLRIFEHRLREGRDAPRKVLEFFMDNYLRVTGHEFVLKTRKGDKVLAIDMTPMDDRHVAAEWGNMWMPNPKPSEGINVGDEKAVQEWRRKQRAAVAISAMTEEAEKLTEAERLYLAEQRGEHDVVSRNDLDRFRSYMDGKSQTIFHLLAEQRREIDYLNGVIADLTTRMENLEVCTEPTPEPPCGTSLVMNSF